MELRKLTTLPYETKLTEVHLTEKVIAEMDDLKQAILSDPILARIDKKQESIYEN